MKKKDEQLQAVCILADVIASRSIDKKQELRGIVDNLNTIFGEVSLSRFVVRNGDEIFGILQSFADGYNALKQLYYESEASSVPLYVGVGFGYITNEDLNNPHEVNGSAVWSASEALGTVKSERIVTTKNSVISKSFKFRMKLAEELSAPDEILNYQAYFILERMRKRTDRQTEIVRAIEREGQHIQYEQLGEQYGYDHNKSVNISKLLSRAEYHLVAGAEDSLRGLLDFYQQMLKTGSGES